MVTAAQRAELENDRARYHQARNMVHAQLQDARNTLNDANATANAVSIQVELLTGMYATSQQYERPFNESLLAYATPDDQGAEQNAHTQAIFALQRDVLTTKAELTTRLTELNAQAHVPPMAAVQQQDPAPANLQNRSIERVMAFKIPEERKFDGKHENYQGSWEMFNGAVHSVQNVPGAVKMTKLLECVKDEAAQLLDGLSVSEANYNQAIQLLQQRIGDPSKIKNAHHSALQNVKVPKEKDGYIEYTTLCKHVDTIEKHLRNLNTAGEDINQTVFISLIKARLPIAMVGKIEEHHQGEWTMDSLRSEMQWYLTVEHAKHQAREAQKKMEEKAGSNVETTVGKELLPSSSTDEVKVSTLVSSDQSGRFRRGPYHERWQRQQRQQPQRQQIMQQQNPRMLCRYCQRTTHYSDVCTEYKTIQQRRSRVHELMLCYNCLGENHDVQWCRFPKKCQDCNISRKHHKSLCTMNEQGASQYRPQGSQRNVGGIAMVNNDEVSDDELIPVLIATSGNEKETVLMKTMQIPVRHGSRKHFEKTRSMADSGSPKSYITKKLKERLELKDCGEEKSIKVGVFGTKEVKNTKVTPAQIVVRFINGELVKMNVGVVDVITSSLTRYPYNATLPEGIKLADTIPEKTEDVEIDFLIGNDYHDVIIGNETIYLDSGLMLKSSKFGWIATGRTKIPMEDTKSNMVVPHVLALINEDQDETKKIKEYRSQENDEEAQDHKNRSKKIDMIEDMKDSLSQEIGEKDEDEEDTMGSKKILETTKNDHKEDYQDFCDKTIRYEDQRNKARWKSRTDSSPKEDHT